MHTLVFCFVIEMQKVKESLGFYFEGISFGNFSFFS